MRDIRLSPLVIHEGVTTADGNVGGTSFIDASLIGALGDFQHTLAVLNPGNVASVAVRETISLNSVTGEVTTTAFGAQVLAGTPYVILAVPSEMASIASILAAVGAGAVMNTTYNHPSGVAEQIALTLTLTSGVGNVAEFRNFWVDLSNLTQNTIIRFKHDQVTPATYRTFETLRWKVGDDPALYIPGVHIPVIAVTPRGLQITVQSEVAEGAARDIYINRSVRYQV